MDKLITGSTLLPEQRDRRTRWRRVMTSYAQLSLLSSDKQTRQLNYSKGKPRPLGSPPSLKFMGLILALCFLYWGVIFGCMRRDNLELMSFRDMKNICLGTLGFFYQVTVWILSTGCEWSIFIYEYSCIGLDFHGSLLVFTGCMSDAFHEGNWTKLLRVIGLVDGEIGMRSEDGEISRVLSDRSNMSAISSTVTSTTTLGAIIGSEYHQIPGILASSNINAKILIAVVNGVDTVWDKVSIAWTKLIGTNSTSTDDGSEMTSIDFKSIQASRTLAPKSISTTETTTNTIPPYFRSYLEYPADLKPETLISIGCPILATWLIISIVLLGNRMQPERILFPLFLWDWCVVIVALIIGVTAANSIFDYLGWLQGNPIIGNVDTIKMELSTLSFEGCEGTFQMDREFLHRLERGMMLDVNLREEDETPFYSALVRGGNVLAEQYHSFSVSSLQEKFPSLPKYLEHLSSLQATVAATMEERLSNLNLTGLSSNLPEGYGLGNLTLPHGLTNLTLASSFYGLNLSDPFTGLNLSDSFTESFAGLNLTFPEFWKFTLSNMQHTMPQLVASNNYMQDIISQGFPDSPEGFSSSSEDHVAPPKKCIPTLDSDGKKIDLESMTSLLFSYYIRRFLSHHFALTKFVNIARITRLQFQLALFETTEVLFVIAVGKFRFPLGLFNIYVKNLFMWVWFWAARHLLLCSKDEWKRFNDIYGNQTTNGDKRQMATNGGTNDPETEFSFFSHLPDTAPTASHIIFILFVMNLFSFISHMYYVVSILKLLMSQLGIRRSVVNVEKLTNNLTTNQEMNGYATVATGNSAAPAQGTTLKTSVKSNCHSANGISTIILPGGSESSTSSTIASKTQSKEARLNQEQGSIVAAVTKTAKRKLKKAANGFEKNNQQALNQSKQRTSRDTDSERERESDPENVTQNTIPGNNKNDEMEPSQSVKKRNWKKKSMKGLPPPPKKRKPQQPGKGTDSKPNDVADNTNAIRTLPDTSTLNTTLLVESAKITSPLYKKCCRPNRTMMKRPHSMSYCSDPLLRLLSKLDKRFRRHLPSFLLLQHTLLFAHALMQIVFYVRHKLDGIFSPLADGSTRPPTSMLTPTNVVVALVELLVCYQLLILYFDFNAKMDSEDSATLSAESKGKKTVESSEKAVENSGRTIENSEKITIQKTERTVQNTANSISAESQETPEIFLSFDSSGWLYLYHFGVATYIQDHFGGKLPPELGCSGASGGILVGVSLISEIDLPALASEIITNSPPCAYNIRRTFRLLEESMTRWIRPDAHEICSKGGRLRILMTQLDWKPPFFKARVSSKWNSWSHLWHCVRASCHIPVLAGVMPYFIPDLNRYFLDGLIWLSPFVQWRTNNIHDTVVKVSAVSMPNADISPGRMFPPWWALFPPEKDVLHGMFWQGYCDAAQYFAEDAKIIRRSGVWCCGRLKRKRNFNSKTKSDPHVFGGEGLSRKSNASRRVESSGSLRGANTSSNISFNNLSSHPNIADRNSGSIPDLSLTKRQSETDLSVGQQREPVSTLGKGNLLPNLPNPEDSDDYDFFDDYDDYGDYSQSESQSESDSTTSSMYYQNGNRYENNRDGHNIGDQFKNAMTSDVNIDSMIETTTNIRASNPFCKSQFGPGFDSDLITRDWITHSDSHESLTREQSVGSSDSEENLDPISPSVVGSCSSPFLRSNSVHQTMQKSISTSNLERPSTSERQSEKRKSSTRVSENKDDHDSLHRSLRRNRNTPAWEVFNSLDRTGVPIRRDLTREVERVVAVADDAIGTSWLRCILTLVGVIILGFLCM